MRVNILRPVELNLIHKVFEAKDNAGWVLDFTNRTFKEFFDLELKIDIDAPEYAKEGTSKGKRLRYFFRTVDNQTAAQALRALWAYRQNLPDGIVEGLPNSAAQIGALITRLENGQATGPVNVVRPLSLDMIDYAGLADRLLQIRQLEPHQRGRNFETFLIDLFITFGLKGAKAFRNTGEEIDGSFELDNEIYLLEAKWWAKPLGAPELHVFTGKISSKAKWTRGLFVSFEGFTDVGLQAYGRGGAVILMEGKDIYQALQRQVRIDDLVRSKVRAASHSGAPFTPFDQLVFG